MVTGTIRSRYADAKALLTLRDSGGIHFAKPIAFRDGLYRLHELLPPGLKYGCALDVLYPEDDTTSRQAHTFARVTPTDRLLKVNVTSLDRVAPGSLVRLDFQVDRQEPIDLIASVYDSSLLAIEADAAPDVRNYYYADDRIANRLDLVLLRRRLGDVRIDALVERVRASLRTSNLSVERRGEWSTLADNYQRKQLTTRDVAHLLRLAGVDVYCSKEANGSTANWYEGLPGRDAPLADLFGLDPKQKRLEIQFVGNTLLLQEVFSQHVPPASHRWHPVYGWDDGDGYLWNKPKPPAGRIVGGGIGGGGLGGGLGGFGGGFAGGIGGGGIGGIGGLGGAGAPAPPKPPTFTALALSNALPIAAAPDAEDDRPLPDLVAAAAVRRNFSDTAYWNAAVRTDATGHATVTVKLPDTLTRWQVVVTAVSPRMHVGGAKASIHTFQPIMVWPMLPRCFTAGDSGEVFASVHNRTGETQTIRVKLKADGGTILTPAEVAVTLKPRANASNPQGIPVRPATGSPHQGRL
ncbi:alpha-2-macroglobulin domain protein [Limnoglobus roseus]|uniref:Alpha-2-macroglobulin domain protein n=1 Tax=Limnoglobus roseus TaxID=2598579 RepID=A0A5C1AC77_9BACT|nr:alpha-2-macroglobulin domain protein [Limnoglobus roseus]